MTTDHKLPSSLRLAQLVQHKTRFAAYLFCHELSRLDRLCSSPDARIETAFAFAPEPGGGHAVVELKIETRLRLNCRRCLAPLDWELAHRNRLTLVTTEDEAAKMPISRETVVCKNGYIALNELVEDEILLLLPQAPTHAVAEECGDYATRYMHGKANRRSPFAALKNFQQPNSNPAGEADGRSEKP